MYVSNDVRVYKNVQIFFSSFFIIFIFDAKVEKGEFQLASTTNRWLKAFYMWSTQTQQTTLTDDKKNIYCIMYPFHFLMNRVRSLCKVNTDAIVWSVGFGQAHYIEG